MRGEVNATNTSKPKLQFELQERITKSLVGESMLAALLFCMPFTHCPRGLGLGLLFLPNVELDYVRATRMRSSTKVAREFCTLRVEFVPLPTRYIFGALRLRSLVAAALLFLHANSSNMLFESRPSSVLVDGMPVSAQHASQRLSKLLIGRNDLASAAPSLRRRAPRLGNGK